MNAAKQIIAGVMIYFTVIGQVFGQAALLPNAEQQYFDNNGHPLASGTVTYYVPGTTTKKTTWQNSTQSINNTNPVNLDIGGKGIMYGQGSYRQVVQDNLGNTIWDEPTTAYGASAPSGATGTDTAPVGTVLPYSGFVVPTNWQLAYGQAVSRTTYATLETAITIAAPSISCTSTSTTLTGFADTSIIRVGAPIEANCLPPSTTVASITDASTIVVSQAAATTATVAATIFPWGNGDQASTFNVPDLRGRAPIGADCMGFVASGNVCAGNMTTAYFSADPSAAGQYGGSEAKHIGIANVNAFTPTGTISAITPAGTVTNGAISVTGSPVVGSTTGGVQGGGTFPSSVVGVGSIGVSQAGSTFAGTPVTPTFTGDSIGSSIPFSVVNPGGTFNYIIKVAPNTSGAGGVVSLGGMIGDISCDVTMRCNNQSIGVATAYNQLTSSRLATVTALPNSPVYNNGTLGVGATLTSGSNSTLTVDGTVANINDAILVQNQVTSAQNGIYTVTNAGGASPWVLTRATYFNQVSNMTQYSTTLVTAGVANFGQSFIMTSVVSIVGTSPVAWSPFACAFCAVTNLPNLFTAAQTMTAGLSVSGPVTGTANFPAIGYQPINGLVSDALQTNSTVSILSGQAALTTSAGLGSACVAGSTVIVPGAGAATTTGGTTDYSPLVANVVSVSGTQYILNANASTTLSGSSQTVTCGTDNTTAVQTAITNDANSYFPFGSYLIKSDILIPGSRGLKVPRGVTVFSAGRFTAAAASISNVKLYVDGQLLSLGLQTGSDMTALGWPTGNRGFIEFGGSSASPASGFTVSGNGKICGEFTGTPNFANSTYQLNRKGIASWFASNVTVNVREVCGFHGETVFALPGPAAVQAIRFTGMYVHDVRFDGINLNAPETSPSVPIGGNEGFFIDHNYVDNAFICIESPIGTVVSNRCNNPLSIGIQWGEGSGLGPGVLANNTVVGGGSSFGALINTCGSLTRSSVSYCLAFGTTGAGWIPGTNFVVEGNIAINPGDSCYVVANWTYGQFANNQCSGASQSTAAHSFDFTNAHYIWGTGNSDVNSGADWISSFVGTTSDNLTIDPLLPSSVGSLKATGNASISTYIAPTANTGAPLLNNSGAAPGYGPLNLAGGSTIATGILPVANGGTGDSGTAWTTTGAPTCKDGGGVAFNTYTSSWRYKTLGKTVFFTALCVITNVSGATSGSIQISLPVTAVTATGMTYFANGQNTNGGKIVFGTIASGATFVAGSYITGGTPSTSGSITFTSSDVFQISGTYESN